MRCAVCADRRTLHASPREQARYSADGVPVHPVQQFIAADANLLPSAETHSVGGQNSTAHEFVYELRCALENLSRLLSGDVQSRVVNGCVLTRSSCFGGGL